MARSRTQQQLSLPIDAPAVAPRRTFQLLLFFIGSVLIANAVVGERGLMATRAAKRDAERLAGHITAVRTENERLREEAHRLRTDPAAVEAVARGEFGLLRPGEVVFLLRDGADADRHDR